MVSTKRTSLVPFAAYIDLIDLGSLSIVLRVRQYRRCCSQQCSSTSPAHIWQVQSSCIHRFSGASRIQTSSCCTVMQLGQRPNVTAHRQLGTSCMHVRPTCGMPRHPAVTCRAAAAAEKATWRDAKHVIEDFYEA